MPHLRDYKAGTGKIKIFIVLSLYNNGKRKPGPFVRRLIWEIKRKNEGRDEKPNEGGHAMSVCRISGQKRKRRSLCKGHGPD